MASVGDRAARTLSRRALAEVVEPRYEEFFELAREELQRSGFENLIAAGVVLSGGSSKMEGVVELAEEVFHMPVRLGLPHDVTGLEDVLCNPIYSTAVGLLLFGNENRRLTRLGPTLRVGHKGLWTRMKDWFQGNF